MTIEMLIGGLIVLTMVAVIVLVTTSQNDRYSENFEDGNTRRKDRDRRSGKRRG